MPGIPSSDVRSTTRLGRAPVLACALALSACASAPLDPLSPASRLEGTDGAEHTLLPTGSHRFTVIVFFMAGCRHLEVHDARLRDLATKYVSKGVDFYAVDSEMHGSMDMDRTEVGRHGYPFPILRDVGGRVARRVGARQAGYSVILDHDGAVRYRGALDSDRFKLHETRTRYVEEALEDLLAGRAPRTPVSEAFGCALSL